MVANADNHCVGTGDQFHCLASCPIYFLLDFFFSLLVRVEFLMPIFILPHSIIHSRTSPLKLRTQKAYSAP